MEENKQTTNQEKLPEGPLKHLIVNYVGDKLKPEKDEVTVEMIVTCLIQEFPECVLLLAEENFIRGYQQAITDIQNFDKTKEEADKVLGKDEQKSSE